MEEETVRIPACFDLAQTLDCGQAFRWRQAEDGTWLGSAWGRVLRMGQEGEEIVFTCPKEDFEGIWRRYFDLDTDYSAMGASLAARNPVLAEAVAFAPGIRILRQEPWEALCSFILSQNNNIQRIKGLVERLCEGWGRPIPGTGFHEFPTAQALAGETVESLAILRAGYRVQFVLDAARKVAGGEVDLAFAASAPLDEARRELQKIHGVGPKVAECALLYGFHRTQCFPMDVWMKRAMRTLLPGFAPEDFGENAGLAQQLIFHYSRLHPELFSEAL